jgi:hypothetical protein
MIEKPMTYIAKLCRAISTANRQTYAAGRKHEPYSRRYRHKLRRSDSLSDVLSSILVEKEKDPSRKAQLKRWFFEL